ncbi:MAG: alpha/beta hydrolase [Novosphingobium sp.]
MAGKAYPATKPEPLILIVPEAPASGPDHWQARWERHRDNCQRLDLGMWDAPHRNTWINKLNLAIYRADRPVLLVGHGLGCLTIAWWAEYERSAAQDLVIGALLIAPPDPDKPGRDPRLAKFAATPRQPLPFPAFLVASANDPACSRRSALQLARDWDCRFADAGGVGHIDGASALGDWAPGQRLLGRLLNEHRPGSYDGPLLHRAARPTAGRMAPRLDG